MKKNEVVCRLQGGLGNQLFQFAASYSLAVRLNAEIIFDTSGYPDQVFGRELELTKFALGHQENVKFEVLKKQYQDHRSVTEDHVRRFDPSMWKSLSESTLLHGYFQSEKYFENLHSKITDLIRLTHSCDRLQAAFEQILSVENPVALHVRRGDYVTNPVVARKRSVCDLGYYKRAVDRLNSVVPNATVFAFSDDRIWVEKQLSKDLNIVLLDEFSTVADLMLMASCKHFIIANSTYSWWGAWLGEKKDSVIVAPSRWFSEPSLERNAIDVVPTRWIRL